MQITASRQITSKKGGKQGFMKQKTVKQNKEEIINELIEEDYIIR